MHLRLFTRLVERRLVQRFPEQRLAVASAVKLNAQANARWSGSPVSEQWALLAWVADAPDDKQPGRVQEVVQRLTSGNLFELPEAPSNPTYYIS